jgi:branched-chain amino acid transport system substrate-binding protein
LKLVAANPDAILIVASGSGAAMPHKGVIERGYKGKIYQTHGVANADFLRVVGAAQGFQLVGAVSRQNLGGPRSKTGLGTPIFDRYALADSGGIALALGKFQAAAA